MGSLASRPDLGQLHIGKCLEMKARGKEVF